MSADEACQREEPLGTLRTLFEHQLTRTGSVLSEDADNIITWL
jgi:hypothetical protein